VVTGLQPRDAWADFLDDPGALVAADDREARPAATYRMSTSSALGGSSSSSVISKSVPVPRRTAALVFMDPS